MTNQKKTVTDFLPNGGIAVISREDCGNGFEVTIAAHEIDLTEQHYGYISMTPPDMESTVTAIEREMNYPIRCLRDVTPGYKVIKTAHDREGLQRIILEFAPERESW